MSQINFEELSYKTIRRSSNFLHSVWRPTEVVDIEAHVYHDYYKKGLFNYVNDFLHNSSKTTLELSPEQVVCIHEDNKVNACINNVSQFKRKKFGVDDSKIKPIYSSKCKDKNMSMQFADIEVTDEYLDSLQIPKVVNDPYTDPEEKARRSAQAAKLLRPKSDEVPVPKKSRNSVVNDRRSDFNSYRTVFVYKMEEIRKNACKEHKHKSLACESKLTCDLEKEEKRGFSSRQTLICARCSYISEKYSLYEELETGMPGRKPSKLDTAVHVGLCQTPIASSSMRKIILSGNMQAPTASTKSTKKSKYSA
ncbi:unnamed protein product [Mytilus coruscus]|uniref:Mutator-like transposase domain-containing protein n=1 Tax=Mytilus coruscus TaxID=42192 RepID=A0A6J8ANG9_MYTCO|nr:unnamed protein product [Mytilus coruscus]